MDRQAEFEKFKAKCVEEGFLAETTNEAGDDLTTGINDDGALWHVTPSLKGRALANIWTGASFEPESTMQSTP